MKVKTYVALLVVAAVAAFLMSCVPLKKHKRMIAVRDTIVAANLERARDLEKELSECKALSERQASILRKFNQVNDEGILWKEPAR